MDVVIVGAGQAGVRAALSLRRPGHAGAITPIDGAARVEASAPTDGSLPPADPAPGRAGVVIAADSVSAPPDHMAARRLVAAHAVRALGTPTDPGFSLHTLTS